MFFYLNISLLFIFFFYLCSVKIVMMFFRVLRTILEGVCELSLLKIFIANILFSYEKAIEGLLSNPLLKPNKGI